MNPPRGGALASGVRGATMLYEISGVKVNIRGKGKYPGYTGGKGKYPGYKENIRGKGKYPGYTGDKGKYPGYKVNIRGTGKYPGYR